MGNYVSNPFDEGHCIYYGLIACGQKKAMPTNHHEPLSWCFTLVVVFEFPALDGFTYMLPRLHPKLNTTITQTVYKHYSSFIHSLILIGSRCHLLAEI